VKLESIAIAIIAVFIAAFAYVSSSQDHEWGGADGQAEDVIAHLTGGAYIPWFRSIYTPPSGEIESLLFALQAAIGSLIIGYFLGYYRAIAKAKAAADATIPETEGKVDA
jgi:cobalt/nickel transport protein